MVSLSQSALKAPTQPNSKRQLTLLHNSDLSRKRAARGDTHGGCSGPRGTRGGTHSRRSPGDIPHSRQSTDILGYSSYRTCPVDRLGEEEM